MRLKKFVIIGSLIFGAIILSLFIITKRKFQRNQIDTDLSETSNEYIISSGDIEEEHSVPDPVRASLQVYDELGLPNILVTQIYKDLLQTDISGDVIINDSTFDKSTYIFNYKMFKKDYSEYKDVHTDIVNKSGIPDEMVERLKVYLNTREIYGDIVIQSYNESAHELTIDVNGEEQVIQHWGEYHQ